MKPSELRIGNYLKYKNTNDLAIVELIHKQHFDCMDEYGAFTTNGNYEPIPLTEEWLLKFDFQKCKGRHGLYFKHKELDAFRVWYNEDLNSWSAGRRDYKSIDKEYNTYWIRDNIKALHQLQNLYFALTREELTLNN